VERSAYSNYESGVREVPFHLLEKIADLFGCEAFLLFEDNVEADNEILATAFRISDVEEGDLKEIAHFKDLVKSYLKMERIGNKGCICAELVYFQYTSDRVRGQS